MILVRVICKVEGGGKWEYVEGVNFDSKYSWKGMYLQALNPLNDENIFWKVI